MRSSYRRIGDFIKPVKEKNKELKYSRLLGINIDKFFMPSVANVVGTNMRNYKIVRPNQFACNRMHVGRDYRIPIALSREEAPFLVSPAYDVFEITRPDELDAEYLMMWFSRKEFDRNAWFYTDADVRGGLAWDAFCSIELPVPPIAQQRAIVAEYNTVVNRIKLNETLNQKLEETAQALYRHWFVDFEFPVTRESHPELVSGSQPVGYKSAGGSMVYNAELDKEVPEGWGKGIISDIIHGNPESITKEDDFKTIQYLDTSSITNNKIDVIQELYVEIDKIPSRAKRKVKNNDIVFSTVRPALRHYGIMRNIPENFIVSTGFAVLRLKMENLFPELIYYYLTDNEMVESLQSKAEMSVSTYPSIKLDDLLSLDFIIPSDNILNKTKDIFKTSSDLINIHNNENQKLEQLKDLLLAKMTRVGVVEEIVN